MVSSKSPRPNHTQFPNRLLDWGMEKVTLAEWAVLCFVVRRTFGFHKDDLSDDISIGQLVHGITRADGTRLCGGCGIKSRTTIIKALEGLEAKGFIVKTAHSDEKGSHLPNTYRIALEEEDVPGDGSDPLSNKWTTPKNWTSPSTEIGLGGSAENGLALVQNLDPQKKEEQKKQIQKKEGKGEQSLLPPPRVSPPTPAPSLETGTSSFQGNGSGRAVEAETPARRAQDFREFLDYWQEHIRPVDRSYMDRFADQYYKARARVGHDQMMGCLRWKVLTDPGCKTRTTFAPVFVEKDIAAWHEWLKRPAEEDTYGKGVKLRTSMVGCGPTLPEPDDSTNFDSWCKHCKIGKGFEHKTTCPHRLTNPIVQGDEPRVA